MERLNIRQIEFYIRRITTLYFLAYEFGAASPPATFNVLMKITDSPASHRSEYRASNSHAADGGGGRGSRGGITWGFDAMSQL
jgi:hypothetical protein